MFSQSDLGQNYLKQLQRTKLDLENAGLLQIFHKLCFPTQGPDGHREQYIAIARAYAKESILPFGIEQLGLLKTHFRALRQAASFDATIHGTMACGENSAYDWPIGVLQALEERLAELER